MIILMTDVDSSGGVVGPLPPFIFTVPIMMPLVDSKGVSG